MSSHPLDFDGHPARLVLARDVTLERRNALELAKYASDLETLNRELDAFSYSVSHDLRAPLRSIDGFSQALLEDYSDSLDAVGKSYLERVRAAAQRMAALIDDLLNLSRVSRAALKRRTINLCALVDAAVTELRTADPTREVTIEMPPNIEVTGDPSLLKILITNLIENAWKYTGSVSPARIEVGVIDCNASEGQIQESPDSPTYFVRDNGIGFDMVHANKLFTPFQRLHSSRDFPGTGIGLATVQRIVHRHGGRVRAEGKVNDGATFFFTLPKKGSD
ncbi:MAG: hypothetical protein K8J08_09680 [Thermoanaerobaculia bacterium]|nr:hypothetical protein [Thermoanaerobaculia bacterium]